MPNCYFRETLYTYMISNHYSYLRHMCLTEAALYRVVPCRAGVGTCCSTSVSLTCAPELSPGDISRFLLCIGYVRVAIELFCHKKSVECLKTFFLYSELLVNPSLFHNLGTPIQFKPSTLLMPPLKKHS